MELKKRLLNQKYDDVFLEVCQACISLEQAESAYTKQKQAQFAIKNGEIVNLKYDAGLIGMQQFLDNQNELCRKSSGSVQVGLS